MKSLLLFQISGLALAGRILVSPAVARDETKKPLSSTAQMVGKPWIGAGGVQRKTADIMSDPAIQKPASVTLRRRAKLPDRKNLPQDVNSLAVATWPQTKSKSASEANAVSPVLSAPQTVSTNFDAATGDPTTGPFPPDAMGAVGPSQFFLFINGRLKTFNKATGAADGVINANPDAFFSTVMTPAVAANSTSNPQIRYDRLTSRWILTIIDTPGHFGRDFG